MIFTFNSTTQLLLLVQLILMVQLDTSKNLDDGTNMRSSVRTGQIRIVNKPESSGLALSVVRVFRLDCSLD